MTPAPFKSEIPATVWLVPSRYSRVGLRGLMEEARSKIADIDSSLGADPVDLRKRSFYKAVETVCAGVVDFAQRYSEEAQRLAKAETEPRRNTICSSNQSLRGFLRSNPTPRTNFLFL